MTEQEAKQFLNELDAKFSNKQKQSSHAYWLLATTGSEDAATLVALIDAEYTKLFTNNAEYEKLVELGKRKFKDQQLNRIIDLYIKDYKANMIPDELIDQIVKVESQISQKYSTFRAQYQGKQVSENDIKEILKTQESVDKRKEVWDASKQVGNLLAEDVRTVVKLRNQAAKHVGFDNYFELRLWLQEIESKWLLEILENLYEKTKPQYDKLMKSIDSTLAKRFKVNESEVGPWAWSDPFCQEDPIGKVDIDSLVKELDFVKEAKRFYDSMGIDCEPVLAKSDLFEREGKDQHAFCTQLVRGEDVRILTNIRPNMRWFDTTLHELGHAVYDLNYDSSLPWVLKSPPHMITTEAMALIAGRQVYEAFFLEKRIKVDAKVKESLDEAKASSTRRQLIFSRWVMVMVNFESQLYANPDQDLNKLWWDLVEKYQGVKHPEGREDQNDWASKYHVAMAPVYYHSYLFGEMFASMILDKIEKETGSREMEGKKEVGELLKTKLFAPGDSLPWRELIKNVVGQELAPDSWVKEFAT